MSHTEQYGRMYTNTNAEDRYNRQKAHNGGRDALFTLVCARGLLSARAGQTASRKKKGTRTYPLSQQSERFDAASLTGPDRRRMPLSEGANLPRRRLSGPTRENRQNDHRHVSLVCPRRARCCYGYASSPYHCRLAVFPSRPAVDFVVLTLFLP